MGEGTVSQCSVVKTWNFDKPESGWSKANWSNGDPFNATWQPDNVIFNRGIMRIEIDKKGCPSECDNKPYASGEYRTNSESYHFGLYETRMKPAKGGGLMAGSFFTYTGTYGKQNHHEIDLEFLGSSCTSLQTNYYVEGKGNHEKIINLGFNACKDFHTYGFLWSKEALVWYVDGKEVHRNTGKMPYKPGKLMVNIWAGNSSTNGWLGGPYKGTKAVAEYDWIRYSDCSGKKLTPAPQETKPAEPKTKIDKPVSVGALTVANLEQSKFSFNGGSISRDGNVYAFSADKARDPGFGILTGGADVSSKKSLKFEIKGSLTKQGNYARFIAQIYDEGDSDSTPSVSLEAVPLKSTWQSVKMDLNGQINKAKKVQFLLVTDKGSCNIEIRNPVFE